MGVFWFFGLMFFYSFRINSRVKGSDNRELEFKIDKGKG